MELYQLKSFAVIAETKNLTKAANTLNISQSALSTQIKTLEEELGLELFNRGSRGMELNDNGRVLLTHAHEILKSVDDLRRKASFLGNTAVGDVAVGINTEPVFLRVSEVSKIISNEHKELHLILMATSSTKMEDFIKRRVLDVSFFYHIPISDDIEYEVLENAEICVAGKPEFLEGKTTWREIAESPWVWAGYGCAFYVTALSRFREEGLKIKQAINCEDEYIIRELVTDGHGLGMFRYERAKQLEAEGHVKIWEPGIIPVQLCIGWLKGRGDDPVVLAVRNAAKKAFEKITSLDVLPQGTKWTLT
jgi:DNA-binding transcriptional LysR family regulator